MPTVTRDGVELYYERDGDDEECVVFVEEAGYGAWSWGWQHAAVAGPYATVTYDHRGTGRSDAPEGPYSMGTLCNDLDAVLRDAGVRRAHLVGLGLGGMVALRYARRAGRVASLTLVGTAASGEAVALGALCAPQDDPAALRSSLDAALSADFRAEQPDVVAGIADWRASGDATPQGGRGQRAAGEEFDATDWLYEVTTPALVLHGAADEVAPVEAGRALAGGLPRGEFLAFEGAGHLVTVERSKPVNDRLLAFLDGVQS